MSKNITTRIAAGTAAVGLAAALVAVGGGAASAAPITGSADAVADFVTGLGLADVAAHDGVEAPGQGVVVNDDGTVTLEMSNPNTDGFTACGVAIYPALDAPGDGVVTAGSLAVAEFPAEAEDGFFTGDEVITTPKLNPGIYAVSSSCSLWDDGGDFLDGEPAEGSSANQPHYFVTLGGLL